jgi:hypothetical protein
MQTATEAIHHLKCRKEKERDYKGISNKITEIQ